MVGVFVIRLSDCSSPNWRNLEQPEFLEKQEFMSISSLPFTIN